MNIKHIRNATALKLLKKFPDRLAAVDNRSGMRKALPKAPLILRKKASSRKATQILIVSNL